MSQPFDNVDDVYVDLTRDQLGASAIDSLKHAQPCASRGLYFTDSDMIAYVFHRFLDRFAVIKVERDNGQLTLFVLDHASMLDSVVARSSHEEKPDVLSEDDFQLSNDDAATTLLDFVARAMRDHHLQSLGLLVDVAHQSFLAGRRTGVEIAHHHARRVLAQRAMTRADQLVPRDLLEQDG